MSLYIFALAGFVGHYVIESVPPLLHTPLMAGTNAISGIALVGSIVVAGSEAGKFSGAFHGWATGDKHFNFKISLHPFAGRYQRI